MRTVRTVSTTVMQRWSRAFVLAVIALPDEHKGEKLVAVSNQPRLAIDEVRQAIRSRGLSNLAVPKDIRVASEIPRLGSGKINYRALDKFFSQQPPNRDPGH